MFSHVHPNQILGLLGPPDNHPGVSYLPSGILIDVAEIRTNCAQSLSNLKLSTQSLGRFNAGDDEHAALDIVAVEISLRNFLLDLQIQLFLFLLN